MEHRGIVTSYLHALAKNAPLVGGALFRFHPIFPSVISKAEFQADRSHPDGVGAIDIEPVKLRAQAKTAF